MVTYDAKEMGIEMGMVMGKCGYCTSIAVVFDNNLYNHGEWDGDGDGDGDGTFQLH